MEHRVAIIEVTAKRLLIEFCRDCSTWRQTFLRNQYLSMLISYERSENYLVCPFG
jgi:hypothetical protein